jgi:hypothetical protein
VNQGARGFAATIPVTATRPYVKVTDQRGSGSTGDSLTSGAYNTRTFNTLVTDTHGIAKLASGILTLPAGTYYCHARVPASKVDWHVSRLVIDVANTVLVPGSNAFAGSADNGMSDSVIQGRFTLSRTTDVTIQTRPQTTNAGSGGGETTSVGTEVYTVAEFWQESTLF